jgi:Mrp family chromosome partitioning ATPase
MQIGDVDAERTTVEELARGPDSPGAPSPLAIDALSSQPRRPSLDAIDAFRSLALTVESLAEDPPIRTIAVLSAEPGDGRSLSAELLAVALSELRPPVRLLDADPFQHRRNGYRGRRRPLLRLRRRPDPAHPPTWAEESWTSRETGNGAAPPFARIPLGTEVFPSHAAFLHEVESVLDTETAIGASVVIDVPACSVSSIGFAVARRADATIVVARPGRATVDVHRQIVGQAELLDVRLLGVVFNEG